MIEKQQKIGSTLRVLCAGVMLFFSGAAQAMQCDAVFPDAASNAGSDPLADVYFAFNSQLLNSPDNILDTQSIIRIGGLNTCVTANCTSTGVNLPAQTFSNFPWQLAHHR